jgi:hypothetical protein
MEKQTNVIAQLEKKGFKVVSNFKSFDAFIYVLAKKLKGSTTTLFAQVDESGEVNGMDINQFLNSIN